MLKAITRQARLVDAKVAKLNQSLPAGKNPLTVAGFFDHHASDEDTQVVVGEGDFEAARRELVPSVSFEELQHYERVRMTFEGAGKKDAPPAITGASGGGGGEKPQLTFSNAAPPSTNGNGDGNASVDRAPPSAGAATQKPDSRRLSAAKLKGLREKTLNSLHRSRSRGDKTAASHAAVNSTIASDSVSQASQDDSEDEYTIDTSHLANGNGKAVVSSAGAGGKGRVTSGGGGKGKASGFGEGAEDEDLYT